MLGKAGFIATIGKSTSGNRAIKAKTKQRAWYRQRVAPVTVK
jgi:hypothetical protein